MPWLVQRQMVCVMSVYGSQMRRPGAEKWEFRDSLERMMGLVELEVMLCIAGDFNAHVGVAEPGKEELNFVGERGMERVESWWS